MNIIIKIRINKRKLLISVKKQNHKSLEKVEKTVEALSDNNKLMFNSILSRNLKHLNFIYQLEMGLNKIESKNFLLSKELNNIKREAQVNTLDYLTKNVA